MLIWDKMSDEIKTCRIRLGDLYEKAYEKDPKAASDLKEVWETSDLTNRELVFGL